MRAAPGQSAVIFLCREGHFLPCALIGLDEVSQRVVGDREVEVARIDLRCVVEVAFGYHLSFIGLEEKSASFDERYVAGSLGVGCVRHVVAYVECYREHNCHYKEEPYESPACATAFFYRWFLLDGWLISSSGALGWCR